MELATEWIASLLVAVSVWMYPRRVFYAALVGVIANGLFILWAIQVDAYGLITLNLILAFINARNMFVARLTGW
jgi:hypothetical protein